MAAEEIEPLAAEADRHGPVLRSHDRDGNRIDEVVYHPAYREMERLAYGSGIVGLRYDDAIRAQRGRIPYAVIYSLGYLFAQADSGLYCPICMTDGVARVIEKFGSEKLQCEFIPKLASRDRAQLFQGAMFLTEKQGGSDVGLNECRAARDGEHEDIWRLYGDKWFCSNVSAEAILALARPDGAPEGTRGLGLFLVPKTLDDGSRNHYRINRLKDKLGVRTMATGEVTFDGAIAHVVGDITRGFSLMTEMLNLSRLYNSVASVAIMRRVLFEAVRHACSHVAFRRPIADHPLMQRTLAELIVEHEAATALVFEAIRQLDAADAGSEEAARALRLLTPLTKYFTARRAVQAASEAMEVLGGNGYIEEFITARLLRDAQVLPIWEGTTNILVLDALRAMNKEGSHEVLLKQNLDRFRLAGPAAACLDEDDRRRLVATVEECRCEVTGLISRERSEFEAKRVTDRLIRVTQLALLAAETEQSPEQIPIFRYFLCDFFGREEREKGALARQIVAGECAAAQRSASSAGHSNLSS